MKQYLSYFRILAFILYAIQQTHSNTSNNEENFLVAFSSHNLGCADYKINKQKTFIERTGSDTIIHNTADNSVKRGDTVVWNNELYDANNEIKKGTVEGFCIILPMNVYECAITIDLAPSGRVMLQGSYTNNPDTLPVVGGTGCFQYLVGGEAELESGLGDQKNITKYDLDLLW